MPWLRPSGRGVDRAGEEAQGPVLPWAFPPHKLCQMRGFLLCDTHPPGTQRPDPNVPTSSPLQAQGFLLGSAALGPTDPKPGQMLLSTQGQIAELLPG